MSISGLAGFVWLLIMLVLSVKTKNASSKCLRRVNHTRGTTQIAADAATFRLQQVLSFHAGIRKKPTVASGSVLRLGRDGYLDWHLPALWKIPNLTVFVKAFSYCGYSSVSTGKSQMIFLAGQ